MLNGIIKDIPEKKASCGMEFPNTLFKLFSWLMISGQLPFMEDYLTTEETAIKKTSKGKGNQIWPGISFKNLCSHIFRKLLQTNRIT